MSEPYDKQIELLVNRLTENPTIYPTAERLVATERLIPEHPANIRLLRMLCNPLIPISAVQLERALAKKLREAEAAKRATAATQRKIEAELARSAIRDELAEAHRSRMRDYLGVVINTERELVPAHLEHGGWTMDYGGTFTSASGEVKTYEAMLDDLQLTAADLGLTRKPLALKDKNIDRALAEYYRAARDNRRATLWRNVSALSEGRDATKILDDWMRVAGYYFKNAALAARAVLKMIWAVKRKMAGLPIPYHHFVVFYSSQQGSGKTTLWAAIKAVIRDLCKDVSDLTDLLSNAQLDLFSYFLVEVPEMTGADRADMPKLKSLVTAPSVSRRVYFTQNMRDQMMCSTFIGTSNVALPTLFKDSSGMRRMVQCNVKRIDHIKPHWDEIINFDFAGLWQAVDHLGPDPLDLFRDELETVQEDMRMKDRVEQWVEEFANNPPPIGYELASSKPPVRFQYAAKALFANFHVFESWAMSGGSPMALSNWSSRLRELIDSEITTDWVYQTHGRRTFFTYHQPAEVIALAAPQRVDFGVGA